MQFFNVLSAFAISWFNTVIDVPVHDDLNQYLEMPYATIEVSSFDIEADYYQRTGVSFTYVTMINTDIVKTYVLYYEAYFSYYDLRSIQKITFNVYDDIDPTITKTPALAMNVDDDPPDLSIGFIYHDNYDDHDDLMVSIDDSEVNYEQIGTYQIIYKVSDTSFNETSTYGSLTIYDHTSPTIRLIEPIIIERTDTTSILDFLDVEDNYDLSPMVTYDETILNRMEVGIYDIQVYVKDQSDNQSMLTIRVHIVDTTPPVIRLVSNPAPIDVFDADVLSDLTIYVIDVFDQDMAIDIDGVTVSHDIQIDRLGTYEITYQVNDTYGNMARETLTVKVVDKQAPSITLTNSLVFQVFGPEQFLNTFFLIEDNYDAYAILYIDMDTSVNYDVIGRYPIVITAQDTSKNTEKYEGYVDIIDDIAPMISQISDIIITDFQSHMLTSYFDVSDNYDQPPSLEVVIDDQAVDYQKIGIYDLIVNVYDLSNNQSSIVTELFVVDVTIPTLELFQTSLTVEMGSEAINLRSMIKIASDNYEDLNIDDVEIEDYLDLSQVGIYQVVYRLKDDSGNLATETLDIIVDDFSAPIISLANITINQHDVFDVMTGIHVTDEGSAYHISCYPNTIDTSQPGDHVITYVAQDERGNYQMATRTVTILESQEAYVIDDFIPIMGIIGVGCILLYVIKKQG